MEEFRRRQDEEMEWMSILPGCIPRPSLLISKETTILRSPSQMGHINPNHTSSIAPHKTIEHKLTKTPTQELQELQELFGDSASQFLRYSVGRSSLIHHRRQLRGFRRDSGHFLCWFYLLDKQSHAWFQFEDTRAPHWIFSSKFSSLRHGIFLHQKSWLRLLNFKLQLKEKAQLEWDIEGLLYFLPLALVPALIGFTLLPLR